MSRAESETSKGELDSLVRRIEHRMRQIDEGDFSGAGGPSIQGLRQRQEAIKRKIDEAIARGAKWEMVRYEFERDFAAFFEQLSALLATQEADSRRDAAALRRVRPARR